MVHFKAAIFVQPTAANVKLIIAELKEPKFKEYHLFFSNIVQPEMLAELARNDDNEVIRSVQEYYADFMAVNEDFFHLGADNSIALSSPRSRSTSLGNPADPATAS